MKIINGTQNIFDLDCDAVCVTTNGMTRRDGTAVMGAGIAKEADIRYKLAVSLGQKLAETGNHCYDMGVHDGRHVITFPTKNDWRDDSDLELIKQSCKELVELADSLELTNVLLPPVGCGCGRLSHETVFPVVAELLDDRFIWYVRK